MGCVKRFLLNEDGPTAVEYAVMLALIVIACSVGIAAMVSATADSFNGTGTRISEAISGSL